MINNMQQMVRESNNLIRKLNRKSPKEQELIIRKRIIELGKLKDKEGVKTVALEMYLNRGLNYENNINKAFARNAINTLRKMQRTPSMRQKIANNYRKKFA